MTALPQKLLVRLHDLFGRGRFASEEDLLSHALDLVEREDAALAAARTQLSDLLEDRLNAPLTDFQPVSLADIKHRYASR